jgi:hypothetical protein
MVRIVSRFKLDKLQKEASLLIHKNVNKLAYSISGDLESMGMSAKFKKDPSSLGDDVAVVSGKVVGFKFTYSKAEEAEADLQLKSYINELNSPNNVVEKIK